MKFFTYLLFITVLFFFTSELIFAQLPQPNHVVIVIEENHGYSQIIGSSAAPYINSLVSDSYSALFTDSHGVTHPSQPNYLWFFSGNNQGVTSDNLPSNTPFTTSNLGAELLKKGITFSGYSEDLPSIGFSGASSGNYQRKHNPWVNWQSASVNSIPNNLNKPFTDFPADYNNLPQVSFIIPNQNNDMHNGSDPSRISAGDTWLKNNLDGYVQWAKNNNSLLILTFDEDDFTSANKIATLFIGEMVKNGSYSEKINHLNVLRTVEDMYGVGYSGASADSSAITDCWDQVLPVELTSFEASYKSNNVTLNWNTQSEINNKGFYIERRAFENGNTGNWQTISFINGHGSSTRRHKYSYIDNSLNSNSTRYDYRLKQVDLEGSFVYSNAISVTLSQPDDFALFQNYPNPFNPSTNISYQIPTEGFVTLKVYNTLGKEVKTLVSGNQQAGKHSENFDASNMSSGIYYYQLIFKNSVKTSSIILLK